MQVSERIVGNAVILCSVLTVAFASMTATAEPADVASALSHPDRPAADVANDARRKPVELLEFAGLQVGVNVIDMEAGGGYYTEILSRSVGSNGSVILQQAPGLMSVTGDAIDRRTANNRLPNVKVTLTRFDQLEAADNSIDLITWMLGPHELGYIPGGTVLGEPEATFQEIRRVLKPGGVLLVSDHIAPDGSGLEAGGTLHRVEESVITDLAEAAGLKAIKTSDVLKNSADPLTSGVYAPEVRGQTSQFVVLYQK